jgi:hypothetical protein
VKWRTERQRGAHAQCLPLASHDSTCRACPGSSRPAHMPPTRAPGALPIAASHHGQPRVALPAVWPVQQPRHHSCAAVQRDAQPSQPTTHNQTLDLSSTCCAAGHTQRVALGETTQRIKNCGWHVQRPSHCIAHEQRVSRGNRQRARVGFERSIESSYKQSREATQLVLVAARIWLAANKLRLGQTR